MNKILYTCITNGYDDVIDPIPQEGWQYILYTDKQVESKVWQIRLIEEQHPKIHRKIKILPHHYLPAHEVSVWLDANISFKGDLNDLIKDDLTMWSHPDRKDIYAESRACIELKKDKEDIIKEQMLEYFEEGFDGNGLVATGLIVRRNIAKIRMINEAWWMEVERYSIRDQLSFPYIANLFNITPSTIPFMEDFEYRGHKKKIYV